MTLVIKVNCKMISLFFLIMLESNVATDTDSNGDEQDLAAASAAISCGSDNFFISNDWAGS